MKAKTASLAVKAISVTMLSATWAFRTFAKGDLSVLETLLLVAGVLATFGDVSLNILIDTIKGVQSGKGNSTGDQA